MLLPSNAMAHYKLTGYRLVEEEDFRYQYWEDCPATHGSPIPRDWRPFIGLAAGTWSSCSSNVDLCSTLDANNYIYRLKDMTEIAFTYVTYSSNGNVVAWVIVFNENDNFYTNGNKYDVRTVALHEFGHVLGLDDIGYSLLPDTRAHMMYYRYTGVKPLHAHDIDGMQSIYGQ